jgi:AdoMet-dependent heme synthase
MLLGQPLDFFVQWHLTERCNLRCTHCYQSGRPADELPFSDIKCVVTEVNEMVRAWEDAYGLAFSLSYNVTGGEPFLRKDLPKVIEEIQGQRGTVSLLTNGTLIDRAKAEMLSQLGVNGIQVSLEGPESIHDAVRGQGSFRRSMQGIEALLGAGLTVTVNVTLSKLNAGQMKEMVPLAARLGVQRLGFSRLVPSGRGKGLLQEMLPLQEVKDLYETLLSIKSNGLSIVTGDPVASQMAGKDDGDLGEHPVAGCAAGVSGLTLRSDGTIMPCRRLPIKIGNVCTDLLREVWATSEVLNRLRNRKLYKGKCGQCPRWAACRGCRAIAYAYSQSKGHDDFLAEDPQCFI